jgi:hypothetical protein
MASKPTGLIFNMIVSPGAAMFTAYGSVAHGVVGSIEQAPSSHKTKQKVRTLNEEKKKNTKNDSKKSTAFGKRLRFVVRVNSI